MKLEKEKVLQYAINRGNEKKNKKKKNENSKTKILKSKKKYGENDALRRK